MRRNQISDNKHADLKIKFQDQASRMKKINETHSKIDKRRSQADARYQRHQITLNILRKFV